MDCRTSGVRIVLKIRLVKALIRSTAIYGCAAWTLNKAEENTINTFEMWVYRRMLRISYTELKTNDWILERIGETRQLLNKVRRMKLTFFSHVKRSSDLEKHHFGRADRREKIQREITHTMV